MFGLQGEVRLFLHNRESRYLDQWRSGVLLSPDGERQAVRIRARSGAGRRVIGCIEGVETPEAAAALVEHELLFDKSAFPQLDIGEYYHHQLLGVTVRNAEGVILGKLEEIHESGEVDVWVVRDDEEERYLPAIKEVVLSVVPGVEIVVDAD